ncbi:MAG: squalene/phytoene synthase family protein [Methylobacteriaceae bacterium]|nr:squalene/phytoene synthase family protein [Methylobacteriaceae bacterium]
MTDERAAAHAACEAMVKQYDRDRWLAGLLLPDAARPAVLALHAFSLEIARVRETVSQPSLGEIRFQWWREALDGARPAEAEAHPVAAALIDACDRFRLPRHALIALIEARTFDLYDDPMPHLGHLEGYCGETSSSLFRLASLVLAGGADPGGAAAAGHAGVAYALAGLMRALPWSAARGQCFVPADLLARHGASPEDVRAGRATPGLLAALAELRTLARSHVAAARAGLADMAAPARPALAPLALVPLWLDRMERADYAPFETPVDAPQWRKQWALWRAS